MAATPTATPQTGPAPVRPGRVRCVLPGIVPGVVVAAVLTVLGLWYVGVAVVVAVPLLLGWWLWRSAADLVLRSLGVRAVGADALPRIENQLEGLCALLGLPVPDLAVVEGTRPNVLAVADAGGDATLVVTSAVEELPVVELEGVLAHELLHVRSGEAHAGAVAAVASLPWSWVGLAGADSVHAAVGRGRELAADRRAALLVRYPAGIREVLARAATGDDGWRPPGGALATLTRWLWFDPVVFDRSPVGELDLPAVRAAALAEF